MKRHDVVLYIFFIILILHGVLFADANETQESDAYLKVAREITDSVLVHGRAYEMLRELTSRIGARLVGSPSAAAAVTWAQQKMMEYGLQNVHLQPVRVPYWYRGEVEKAEIINSETLGTYPLTICALGNSVGTPALGLVAPVLEVQNFDELDSLAEKARGRIIFFNRAMDPRLLNTFAAYSRAVDQRVRGAARAAKVGAVAVLVRSVTTRQDDVPHTGVMVYDENLPRIPAAAISTVDADLLSSLLQREKEVRVRLELDCRDYGSQMSANVIGEITGEELPEKVVLIGAHLDSWDKGQGAHDDGAGCVQAIEALRLLKACGLRPRRTIRVVLFMGEETGIWGGRAYADSLRRDGPVHFAAIESDRGGFMPRGFTINAADSVVKRIARYAYLFSDMQATTFRRGGGGADISPLQKVGTTTIGLLTEMQRYFDYHHSDNDTFDKVNERELSLGAAAMAILAYVLAMEGL